MRRGPDPLVPPCMGVSGGGLCWSWRLPQIDLSSEGSCGCPDTTQPSPQSVVAQPHLCLDFGDTQGPPLLSSLGSAPIG